MLQPQQDPKFNGKFPLGMLVPDRFAPNQVNVLIQPGESVHYALFEKILMYELSIYGPGYKESLKAIISEAFDLSTTILDEYSKHLEAYQKQQPQPQTSPILTKS